MDKKEALKAMLDGREILHDKIEGSLHYLDYRFWLKTGKKAEAIWTCRGIGLPPDGYRLKEEVRMSKLVDPPTKTKTFSFWVNCWSSGSWTIHKTEKGAESFSTAGRPDKTYKRLGPAERVVIEREVE